jgi:hypothetical protein
MTEVPDYDALYDSHIRKGSYFNKMIQCGYKYNSWIEEALKCVPSDILYEHRDTLYIISPSNMDACRISRDICLQREIIVISDRVMPKGNVDGASPSVRYLMFVVLHEVVHAVKNHKPPNTITEAENDAQEKDANDLALHWYNCYVEERFKDILQPLSIQEIQTIQNENQSIMNC